MYIKYTYVDAVTGIPVTRARATNGFKNPPLSDLQFRFAEESHYPTETPTLYGVVPDQPLPPGVERITEDEYNIAYAGEMDRRRLQRVPQSISQRQARIVLHRRGYLQNVVNTIDALEEPLKTEAQIAWEYSPTVDRNDPLVLMLSQAFEWSEEFVDDLFIEAAQL